MYPMRNKRETPSNEKKWIFLLMTFIGGYYGAFTYSIRGGVFCNAQTGNFVLLAMALGNRNWQRAVYYLIPITAYCMGAFISEMAAHPVKRTHSIHWEAHLIMIEMAAVLFMGFLPESAPVQITQVLVNFICSMQYNTFRRTEGLAVATTFCTNHIRQVGAALSHIVQHDEEHESVRKLSMHLEMIGMFVLGGIFSTIFCGMLLGKAIWIALIPLSAALFDLVRSDLSARK